MTKITKGLFTNYTKEELWDVYKEALEAKLTGDTPKVFKQIRDEAPLFVNGELSFLDGYEKIKLIEKDLFDEIAFRYFLGKED